LRGRAQFPARTRLASDFSKSSAFLFYELDLCRIPFDRASLCRLLREVFPNCRTRGVTWRRVGMARRAVLRWLSFQDRLCRAQSSPPSHCAAARTAVLQTMSQSDAPNECGAARVDSGRRPGDRRSQERHRWRHQWHAEARDYHCARRE